MINRIKLALLVCLKNKLSILLFFSLNLIDFCHLSAEPAKITFGRTEDSEVYIKNTKAEPSGVVKGRYKGRELTFKKFDGVHELLSITDKIRGKAEIVPLGGKIRGGVKSGFEGQKAIEKYVNETFTTNSPHLNTISFENKSIFEAVSAVGEPYYFYNNKYFTNSGTFRVYDTFDSRNYETYENLLGEMDFDPIPSEVFVNKQDALIESSAPSIVTGGFNINAKKIINNGKISASTASIININGEDVDLNLGAIEIKSPTTYDYFGKNRSLFWGWWGGYQGRKGYYLGGGGDGEFGGGVHLGHYGMTEGYWGIVVEGTLGNRLPGYAYPLSGKAEAFMRHFPITEIETKYPIIGTYSKPYGGFRFWDYLLGGDQFEPYVWEARYLIGDNGLHIIQVVCVRSDNDEVEFDVRMDPLGVSTIPNDNDEFFYFGGPVVQFNTTRGLTNVITGGEEVQSISIIDELPNVETIENFGVTNLFSVPMSNQEVPDNFTFTRYLTAEFEDGYKADSVLDGFTFSYGQLPITYQQASVGVRITNILSRLNANSVSTTYSKTLGGTNRNLEPFLSSDLLIDVANGRSDLPVPDLKGVNPLDQPGRVKIKAKNLDLTNTRIRAEGSITLDIEHLIGSSNAVLDCQNLDLKVSSTNGLLVVENLAPESVDRFSGAIEASSAAWKSEYELSIGDDTEQINTYYSFLLVDGQFSLTNSVHIHRAIFEAEEVVLEDKLSVLNKFGLGQTERLIINNMLKLGTGANTGQFFWDKTVAPNLKSIEINGILDVPENQKFGTDRSFPFDRWVNNGTNLAFNTYINSKLFENNGVMESAEFIDIKASNASLAGRTKSYQGFKIEAENLRVRNQTNISVGPLSISAKNILTDGGAPGNSYLEAWEGISLKEKPKQGDLLGSKILVLATNFTERVIQWPSEDRGANVDGYLNNASVGYLVLSNAPVSKIILSGNDNENNAIYVDYLEFSNRDKDDLFKSDIQISKFDHIDISDNYTVYFAKSNLPEELLNGMYDGRLRWVKEYPGYYSSMPFYVTGLNKTIHVNRMFRQSTTIDTDGDGTANGFDITPFGRGLPDVLTSEITDKGKGRIRISWMGIPDSLYHIVYRNHVDSEWQILRKYHHSKPSVEVVSFEDDLNASSGHRFYKVVFID